MSRFESPRRADAATTTLAVLLLAAGVAGRAPQGGVSGRVIDGSGEPLSAAEVALETVGHEAVRQTLTDSEGRFRIVGVPAGPYSLAASDSTHPVRHFGEFSGAHLGVELMVDASGVVEDVNVRLVRGGVVAGVIRVVGGEPAQGAQVALLPKQDRRIDSPSFTATTDTRGRYRVFGIPAGAYTVAAKLARPMVQEALGDVVTLVVPTLYGDTTDFDAATAFDVVAGGTITADISLQARPAGRISGALRSVGQIPSKSYQVRASPPAVAPQWWIDAVTTTIVNDEGERFAFPDLPAGPYRIEARRLGSAWSPQDSELLGIARTVVMAGASQQVDVPLAAGLSIGGSLECLDATRAPAPAGSVTVSGLGALWPLKATVAVDTDGIFTIAGLVPGWYRIDVAGTTSSSEWKVHELSVGGDASDVPEVLIDASDVPGVNIRCSTQATTFGGAVTQADGSPLAGVLVVLVEAEPGKTARVVRPDSRGRYELADVPAGDLRVGVVNTEAFLEASADLVEQVRANGLTIQLAPGEQRLLTLKAGVQDGASDASRPFLAAPAAANADRWPRVPPL